MLAKLGDLIIGGMNDDERAAVDAQAGTYNAAGGARFGFGGSVARRPKFLAAGEIAAVHALAAAQRPHVGGCFKDARGAETVQAVGGIWPVKILQNTFQIEWHWHCTATARILILAQCSAML